MAASKDISVSGGAVDPALSEVVERSLPGAVLVEVTALVPDASHEEGKDGSLKAAGYGAPLKLRVRVPEGGERLLVFHTASKNPYGHDYRADRAAEMILAYDTFGEIPQHVAPLDMGAVRADHSGLVSLAGTGEFYLLSAWAAGHVYADELRAVVQRGGLEDVDRTHSHALASYLVKLHTRVGQGETSGGSYSRAIRDLVGSGEGIFGIVDGYGESVVGAPRSRIREIERRCWEQRAELAAKHHRLSRIHGDYHPFNLIFGADGELALLDASRGSRGEPADDVTALAINYLFFALSAAEPAKIWNGGLRELWYLFWDTYLGESGDEELRTVVAPFLAWRGLVLTSPAWYPDLTGAGRNALLTLVERALAAERFEPNFVEGLVDGC